MSWRNKFGQRIQWNSDVLLTVPHLSDLSISCPDPCLPPGLVEKRAGSPKHLTDAKLEFVILFWQVAPGGKKFFNDNVSSPSLTSHCRCRWDDYCSSEGRGGPRTTNPYLRISLPPSHMYWLPWPSHEAHCPGSRRESVCIFYFNSIGRVCIEKRLFFFFFGHPFVFFIGPLPCYRMWRVDQFLTFVMLCSQTPSMNDVIPKIFLLVNFLKYFGLFLNFYLYWPYSRNNMFPRAS